MEESTKHLKDINEQEERKEKEREANRRNREEVRLLVELYNISQDSAYTDRQWSAMVGPNHHS